MNNCTIVLSWSGLIHKFYFCERVIDTPVDFNYIWGGGHARKLGYVRPLTILRASATRTCVPFNNVNLPSATARGCIWSAPSTVSTLDTLAGRLDRGRRQAWAT